MQHTRGRRALLAAAGTAALLAAVPAMAAADTVTGTVVARDAARGTVVAAGRGGKVATLRVRRAGSFRPGLRVRATATLLRDGTYEAARVKRQGRAARASLRATIVRRRGRAYLVSAGGSTFAVRAAGRRALGAPGDVVVARLRLAKGRFAVHHTKCVDETSELELEGIFLDSAEGVLRIAVRRHGLLIVAVPEGIEVAAEPGDEVELLVTVGEDGAFTLVKFRSEDWYEEEAGEQKEDELEEDEDEDELGEEEENELDEVVDGDEEEDPVVED